MANQQGKTNFKNALYQELGSDVLNSNLETSVACNNIAGLLSGLLPSGEALRINEGLHKRKIGINLNSQILKKSKTKRRKTGLSQKELRAEGLFRLPRSSISYEEALPMNTLWEGYMHRFLDLNYLEGKEWYNPKSGNLWDQISVTLLKADYHGARLRVASSLCNSMVGLEGIVIIDTKFTFRIVGEDDVTRTIPKESCIFDVFLKNYKFKIFGKYFCIRSNERSTKKVKCLFIPSL